MTSGRGTSAVPGRMLAVEPGGLTQGVGLRLSARLADEELRVLWTREMIFGSYRPAWTSIKLDDGSYVDAITFVADPLRAQYQSDATISVVSPIIGAASGPFGSNAEYVFNLRTALARSGLFDAYIESLAAELDLRANASVP